VVRNLSVREPTVRLPNLVESGLIGRRGGASEVDHCESAWGISGAVDRAEVDVRGLVRTALERNAAAVILAHNPPSGVAQPSREDVAFTARVRAGLAFVEVALLAHFVVGEGRAVRVQ
jgi:hypothetical protein